MKRKMRKLVLTRETLGYLADADLRGAAGAGWSDHTQCSPCTRDCPGSGWPGDSGTCDGCMFTN